MATSDPVTRYAKAGDVHIAYQVIGHGAPLVIVPGFVSHVELQWEDSGFRSFIRRLARFSTVVRFDKRGTGLSDPTRDAPTLEEREADLTAVIDAAGVEGSVLLGISDGGPIAMRLAASMGPKLSGLVLYGTYSHGPPPEAIEQVRAAVDVWGTGQTLEIFAPSLAGDPAARTTRARFERESASPAMARALLESVSVINTSELLAQIAVPTLVIYRRGDRSQFVDGGRFMAGRIASARLAELDGADHLPWLGESQAIVDEIERFFDSVFADRDSRFTAATVAPARPTRPKSGWASLTSREQSVAVLVAEGCSNPVIAKRLFISRHTVETHIKHIFAKLGIDSRTALIKLVDSRALAARNT